jgi:hypothetical protein
MGSSQALRANKTVTSSVTASGPGEGPSIERADVPSIWTHQHRVSDCRTIENDVAAKPSERERADEAPRHFGIASRCIGVPTHQAEAFPKLDHVIRTGIGDCKPASRAENSRRFGEALRREDA